MGTKNCVNDVVRVEQTERIFESWRDVVKAILFAAFIIYLAVFVGRELRVLDGFLFVFCAFVAVLLENEVRGKRPMLEFGRESWLEIKDLPYIVLFGGYLGVTVLIFITALIASSR